MVVGLLCFEFDSETIKGAGTWASGSTVREVSLGRYRIRKLSPPSLPL